MTWTDKYGRPELIPGDDVTAITSADRIRTVVYSEEHTYRPRTETPAAPSEDIDIEFDHAQDTF